MIDRTKLSTGTQSFPALREYGQIYVDKTAMINEIARGRTKVFLQDLGVSANRCWCQPWLRSLKTDFGILRGW